MYTTILDNFLNFFLKEGKYGDWCICCCIIFFNSKTFLRQRKLITMLLLSGYGATTDGSTTYINACTCTLNYRSCNEPIIFDIPLPTGVTKADFLSTESNSDTVEQAKGATSDESEEMEEEVMDVPVEKVEEKGPLVLNQNYQLEPTLAPHSSTSTDGAFKIQ